MFKQVIFVVYSLFHRSLIFGGAFQIHEDLEVLHIPLSQKMCFCPVGNSSIWVGIQIQICEK